MNQFDVIVIGGGHAGIEACLATSRLGFKTLLVTTNKSRIGYMSCNPAIGGLAKGHMVRELDILGGEMGLAADKTCIQFKRLNSKKGPAVRGTRTQCDKDKYSAYMQSTIFNQENLQILESEVKSLLLEKEVCAGVTLEDGAEVRARTTIITTGTFMNGVMHVGLDKVAGGRVGDKASVGLSDQLRSLGFVVRRLKTGTPARLHKDSIDWSKTIPQPGDEFFYPFSFRSPREYQLPQVTCYLSRTNEKTHDIIRKNLDRSPMFCGRIEGIGPRYCPSIEDKIHRFVDKTSHQTFLEPEGLDTDLIYLQGISTSLPADVQDEFLKTIPGLENVKVIRYGYAVEYDFIEPTQIRHHFETAAVKNLFLAGQINGTSGYEEAAAQGFLAGVNAAHRLLEKEPFILRRDEAYMGVLIDDLVTKGTQEPYRMFTSRAEHRLILREDNTADRLFQRSLDLGLVKGDVEELYVKRKERRAHLLEELKSQTIYPNEETLKKLEQIGTPAILKPTKLETLMRRQEIGWEEVGQFFNFTKEEPAVIEAVEIEVKYSGYVTRQKELIQQASKMENMKLPDDISYSSIRGLSSEEIEKLDRLKPRTLGQASRISGVNPSAVQSILVYLNGHKLGTEERPSWKLLRKKMLSQKNSDSGFQT
ncbi:MAG: tRNA uridine-5-carboxymethylaminomethyl(34) synthesis enzyme MnmG [Bdellovibrionales bacterium]